MRILAGKSAESYVHLIERRGSRLNEIEPTVRNIVEDVRRRGDRALLKYARKFDGLGAKQNMRVSNTEMRTALDAAPTELVSAVRTAERRIRHFSERHKPKAWTQSAHGISLGQLVRPLDSVGCYVPGGRFPLVSTLLMTVIPAQVAGVKSVRVVSPKPSPEVLAAAALLGVRDLFRVGGTQAIAALAYGTETVARVDKIVGPGNIYVAVAKAQVAADCAIDFFAGPTEIVVVAGAGHAKWYAADLVAQAEHDPDARSILITWQRR